MNLPTTKPFQPYLSVHASAGSGKTHQLVNRLLYLLLHGAEPGGILAITFTRKAAAEMSQRLLQRVQILSSSEDEELEQQFKALQITPTPELRRRAADLHENLLYSDYPVRSTTFHSFCQDLLRRFPMEADVPPGFELMELTQQLLDEAWDSFSSELTRQPSGYLAQQMDLLLRKLELQQTKVMLFEFVVHRSDWWALTQGKNDTVQTIYKQLVEQLETAPEADPIRDFLTDTLVQSQLQAYHDLLLQHPNKTNTQLAQQIATGLQSSASQDFRLSQIWNVFFTTKNEPRLLKPSKTLSDKLGAVGAEQLLSLHADFCEGLIEVSRKQHAVDTLQLSQAWMHCGEALLNHYQGNKQNQRVLDFSYLEWNSYL